MVTSTRRAKEIATAFNKLGNDKQRLVYIINHPNELMLQLDNDYSHVSFIQSEDEDSFQFTEGCELKGFDEFFGCSEGVYLLFDQLGIRAESI